MTLSLLANQVEFVKLAHTIGFKLFLLIGSVQALILAALTFASDRIQQSELMDNVNTSAVRVSHLIARSTRYSMLRNQKEDVHNIIASIGGEPGIDGIRIYNKQGEVIFGTVPAEMHTTVDMTAEACVSCHASERLDDHRPSGAQLTRIFTKPNGDRVLGLITPIRNEVQCSDASCHAHPASKTILGVLDVKMSLVTIDRQLASGRTQLFMYSLGAVALISVISGWFIWMFVRRPVRRLTQGMEMVSSGHLDHRLEATARDELGHMAGTFNTMTADLARARAEITAWSTTLEEKVREKTGELEKAHAQMMRVEKLASLGNLAATVAHELNNPLEGILTFARLLVKRIRKTSLPEEEITSYTSDLTLVADEAQRCGNIVKNLLVFARQQGGSFQEMPLRTIVDRCMLLMNHHAHMHNVTATAACPDTLVAEVDANKIQQALIALMVNAIEAMASPAGSHTGGRLNVEGSGSNDTVCLCVTDTGAGMTEEVKAHIFEPFFTTKSEMRGVGLGLSVVYGIVRMHHGTIDVQSDPGQGTTFTITLPVRQPAPVQDQQPTSALEGTLS